jgi:repressor LexA
LPRSEPTAPRDAPGVSGRRVSDGGVQSLTEIERKILDFMVQYLRANTYQPSIREIGERFGIKSTKTVSEHLQALADKGFLERDPSRSRGVRILGVDLSAQTVSVPCFSQMPEGRATKADFHLSIDRRLAGENGGFFFRAGPNDLAMVGVHEGDYVLIEPSALDDLEDGAVVVARGVGAGWFHRLTRNGTGLRLEALRPGGDVTTVSDPDCMEIVGRVAAFYRRIDDSAGGLNLTQH